MNMIEGAYVAGCIEGVGLGFVVGLTLGVLWERFGKRVEWWWRKRHCTSQSEIMAAWQEVYGTRPIEPGVVWFEGNKARAIWPDPPTDKEPQA